MSQLPPSTENSRPSGRFAPLAPDVEARLHISFLRLAEILVRNARLLVLVPLATATLAVLYTLAIGRTYRVDASFAPEAPGNAMQRAASLAAQFGMSLGGSNATESVDFYADLVRSRSILEAVARQRYIHAERRLLGGADTVSGTLLELYGEGGRTETARLNRAIQRLSGSLGVRPVPRSNLVRLSVVAPSRELAEQIAAQLLQSVSDFNVAKRQSRAASERAFVSERLRLAQQELQAAERGLEEFLQRNRRYQDSPPLMVEYGRLQRRVELRQQVANSLSQAFEQSRIEEVRNTPVITVVERPEGASKAARTLRQAAVVGWMVGLLGIAGFVLLRELFRAQRALDPEGGSRLVREARALLPRRRRRPEPASR